MRTPYELPDLRVGDPQEPDPLERYSWPELRELIYSAHGPWCSRSTPTPPSA